MVVVRGLSHKFGSRPVLQDINLEVAPGEILAVMGSSGGGKTTLLRCISGLIVPTQGGVTVGGIDVAAEPESARLLMGMVFQMAALFDFLNVRDNVLFGPRRRQNLQPSEQDALVEEVLTQVGLSDVAHLFPSELSGGMRKRVGIARALALRPKVMLYDEPTTGLDPITTYAIDALMVDLRDRQKITSLVVSHDVTAVVRVADRVAFLENGGLSFIGDVDAFAKSDNKAIQEVITKANAKDFLSTK